MAEWTDTAGVLPCAQADFGQASIGWAELLVIQGAG